jgi:hypothetical protein
MERRRRTSWTGGQRPQHASARTVSITASAFRNAFFAFLPGSAQQVEFAVTHSKQSTAPVLPGSRIASLAHGESSNVDSKLSEERAWLRL